MVGMDSRIGVKSLVHSSSPSCQIPLTLSCPGMSHRGWLYALTTTYKVNYFTILFLYEDFLPTYN